MTRIALLALLLALPAAHLSGFGMPGGGAATFPTADGIIPAADPGAGPWAPVPPGRIEEECRLDGDLLRSVELRGDATFAVIRHGRLCFVSGENGSHGTEVNHNFSVTKTLSALLMGHLMYETRDLPRTGPRTGPLGEFDRVADWIDLDALPDSARIHPEATIAHVLAMVGFNESLAHGDKSWSYDTRGNREINYLSNVIDAVVAQDPERLGANAVEFKDRFFERIGLEHSAWGARIFGYSWYGSLQDLGRVGLVILNGGVYGGERLVDAEYIYRMTRPAFEDASNTYGYLTWVNNLSCAPRAIHRSYPHGLSEATDCGTGDCEQRHDVGAWSALGAQGQFILGHRGLDLVVVGQNWGSAGPAALWQSVLPAIVAHDPVYRGNEEAFCAAYGAGDHAPDLRPWEGGL